MKPNYLKLGFKKVYPDQIDKTYFYWRKNFKHNLLSKPHIIVYERINLWTKDSTCKWDVLLVSLPITEINLTRVINFLT